MLKWNDEPLIQRTTLVSQNFSLSQQLPEFLVSTADGDIVLRGHRIGLYHVVQRYNDGYSPEMLVCQYPTLPLSLVHRVIAFYLDHRADVDAYVADYDRDLQQQAASSKPLELAGLRDRLDALREPLPATNG